MSIAPSVLLDVPDEVLINIAQRVDAVGLLGLSLSNRRVRPIAQEALVRTAVVSPKNIWKLADTLDMNPTLGKALTHLRIGPMTQPVYDVMKQYALDRRAALSYDQFAIYTQLLEQVYPECCLEFISSTFVKGDFTSSGLAVLLARATRLNALTLGSNSIDCIPLMARILGNIDMEATIALMYDRVRLAIRDGLQELNIYDELGPQIEQAGDTIPCVVDFLARGLRNVKHLTSPCWQLTREFDYLKGYFYSHPNPVERLPKVLISLRIVCDSWGDYDHVDTDWLDGLISNSEHFHYLKEVEMQHEGTLWTTALLFAKRHDAPSIISKLARWDKSTIAFRNFFGDMKAYGTCGISSYGKVYVVGDLLEATRRCYGTPMAKLIEDPVIAAALGEASRLEQNT